MDWQNGRATIRFVFFTLESINNSLLFPTISPPTNATQLRSTINICSEKNNSGCKCIDDNDEYVVKLGEAIKNDNSIKSAVAS